MVCSATACSLKCPQLLRVNQYSRRQAAVNQIISIPHGRKPVGQQTYLFLPTKLIKKEDSHERFNQY